eukprot:g25621.t1
MPDSNIYKRIYKALYDRSRGLSHLKARDQVYEDFVLLADIKKPAEFADVRLEGPRETDSTRVFCKKGRKQDSIKANRGKLG